MWVPGSSREKKQRTLPSMCLHESLNSSPRGITGLCCPPGLHARRGEGKECAEPPGLTGPLINSHVLQAREWPGNSLLCNVSSAGRCAANIWPPNAAAGLEQSWRCALSAGGAQLCCCGQGRLQDFSCRHAPWPGLQSSGVSLALVLHYPPTYFAGPGRVSPYIWGVCAHFEPSGLPEVPSPLFAEAPPSR